MITLTLNGETRDVPEGSLADLLTHLNLKREWTIVEHNTQAIDRDVLESVSLNPGDVIEIVRAVAGG